MRYYLWFAIPVFVLASGLLTAAGNQTTQNTDTTRTLEVKLHYTGSGTVDEKHPILVFVFDTADFMQGQVPPIALQTAKSKDETLVFKDLTASPVYMGAVYDPSGEYQGDSLPPSGSSIGIYAKTPGVPAPINLEPGKTVRIELAFDDSHKMQ